MWIFASISKPTAPAPQSRRGRGPSCGLISVTWLSATERASQLTTAQEAVQWQMQASEATATHKAGPQQDRAMQQGQQATKAARPGAAPAQARNTNKQPCATNKGKSIHTSLIPSRFRAKSCGSAQREEHHDRTQASCDQVTKFEHIRVQRWVCRCKSSSRQSTTTSQQRTTCTGSMHPLGATWNHMGINRRSKQVVYTDE